MSIKAHPAQPPLTPKASPSWGELIETDKPAEILRFMLSGRVVSVPFAQFKYWELAAGDPEFLTLHTDKQTFLIEGRNLAPVGLELDHRRVTEIRSNREHQSDRTAPQVREITIETA